jgi:hypothetical protein
MSPPTTAVPPTTATSPAPPATTIPPIGPRSFVVSGAVLAGGNWLTVGLHPTTAPVQLHASSAAQLEICPAGLDGSLTDSSWPPFFHFPGCVAMPAGSATLPPTDGNTHVAVAIKTTTVSVPVSLTLTVDYSATDTFVEVIPPSGEPTSLTVTYTPLSSTTAATVTPVILVTPAPGYTLTISQAGRPLTAEAPCDSPTELETCVGGVAPGEPAEVHVSGPGSQPVVLSPAWK